MKLEPGTQKWWTVVAIISCSDRIRQRDGLPQYAYVTMTADDVTTELQRIGDSWLRRMWYRHTWRNLREIEDDFAPKDLVAGIMESEGKKRDAHKP